MRATEVWGNDKRLRAATIARGPGNDPVRTVRLAYGGSPYEIATIVKTWGPAEVVRVVVTKEKWYWDIPRAEAIQTVLKFRKNARNAGFKQLGTYEETA